MKIIKISAGDKEKIDTIVQILSRFSTDKGFPFSPSDICLALTEGEVVFGGLIAEVNWDWIYIKIMAIEPRAQRRGYGKELIKAVEEFGRKENLV
ncbi:MAG: GNAT family N-acetyltransferase, partial [Hyphomicrobiales bacterium]|nr:GNAT family N-acetyltransferase [Hyphomicrobiales bacterium]